MSYAVTDAVEQDGKRELEVLSSLADEIDQLAATARTLDMFADARLTEALDLAWYYAMSQLVESGAATVPAVASAHYESLKRLAMRMK